MLDAQLIESLKALPFKERQMLLNILSKDVQKERKTREERFGELATIIEDYMGEPIKMGCRKANFVWARTMIAYQMRQEGFTSNWIGKCLHLDHSSVFYMCGKMQEALKHPSMYYDILPMWNNFQEKINETEQATI